MSSGRPGSKYYYINSMSKLKSERAMLRVCTKMKEEQFRLQWETTKEFVSPDNVRELIDEKLQPLRNITGILSGAYSTIVSLISGRHRIRGCR